MRSTSARFFLRVRVEQQLVGELRRNRAKTVSSGKKAGLVLGKSSCMTPWTSYTTASWTSWTHFGAVSKSGTSRGSRYPKIWLELSLSMESTESNSCCCPLVCRGLPDSAPLGIEAVSASASVPSHALPAILCPASALPPPGSDLKPLGIAQALGMGAA